MLSVTVTSGVPATGIELQIGLYRYRFANEGKLILLKHILFSSILVNNRVIVIENGQKKFQLQLQQNRAINGTGTRYIHYTILSITYYNFSKPASELSATYCYLYSVRSLLLFNLI